MRFAVSLVTMFAVLFSLLPVLPDAQAVVFTDVSGATRYREAIETLQAKGVVEGNPDGTYRPTALVNRAELLKILLEARGDFSYTDGRCFPDVRDEWFAPYVCAAKEERIVAGYPDGAFRPESPVNFAEAAKIFSLAYGHMIEPGSEWYEPYARALDAGKAIPPSIQKLDAPLTRGEMAEMMWRLSEGKTDEESKGYLNVKYPEITVSLASDKPQKLGSCVDLKAFTDEAAYTQGYGYGGAVPPNVRMAEPAMMAEDSAAKSTTANPGYSTTNVQVAGVDEGDIVKTDGEYMFVVSRTDGRVRIVDVRSPANPKVVSTIQLKDVTASELYIDGSTLVVVGSLFLGYDPMPYPVPLDAEQKMAVSMIYPGPWQPGRTVAVLFDVRDKTSPKETRRVAIEGHSISTRVHDGSLILVLTAGPRWFGPYMESRTAAAEGLVPVFDDSAKGVKDRPVVDCDDVTILPRVPRPQYMVIASVPLTGSGDVDREVILGDAQQVYVSHENIYVAATEWQYSWMERGQPATEKTNIYRFVYAPGSVTFAAQGSVPGHLLNQFSMDEHGDTFRVATTIGETWDSMGTPATPSRNNMYVLNAALETVGSVENIAPGETIYSVRFVGDRAYMVTFKKIDPFFVIDLRNARAPKILGALKIPGYSDYLHPYDENHVIGFGKDAVDSGKEDFAWYQGMKVALFDVSDVSNPKEKFKTVIGDRGTHSPLLHDHKALLFDRERNLLAFPVQVLELTPEQKAQPNDGSAYGSPVFQGAYVYDLSLSGGFDLRGKITHYTEEDFLKSGSTWYGYGKDIERIVRVGSSLFTVSEGMLKSNNLQTLTENGSVRLADVETGQIRY